MITDVVSVKVDVNFYDNVCVSRTGYMQIVCMFFSSKNVAGSICKEHIKSILKPEVFDKFTVDFGLKTDNT
jgi:hypothetical protein